MSKCPGVHCPGCGKGGGTTLIILGILAAIAYTKRHVIETLAIDALIGLGCLIGLVMLGTGAFAVLITIADKRAKRQRIATMNPVMHPNYQAISGWQPINTPTQRIISNPVTIEDPFDRDYAMRDYDN